MRVRLDKSHTWEEDRIIASFRINKGTWIAFDEYVTEHYGNYKKSILIENLIEKFLKHKNSKMESLA